MKFAKFLIIAGLMGIAGCSLSPTQVQPGVKKTFLDAGKALIDMPDAVTGNTTLGKALASGDAERNLGDIYAPAKMYTLLAQAMLKMIVRPLIDTFGIEGVIPYNALVDNNPLKITADESTLVSIVKSSTMEYMYNLDFWRVRNNDTLKMLEISFSDDGTNLAGKIALDVKLLDKGNTYTAGQSILTIAFANRNGSKEMTVEMSGIIPENPEGPDTYILHATKENDIIKVSGASHHKYTNSNSNALDSNRCYIFVANVNDARNKAAIKLAFPPDTVSSGTGIFSTYDIASLVKDIWLSAIRDTFVTHTNIGKAVVVSIRDSITVGDIAAGGWGSISTVTDAEVTALTNDDIMEFLRINEQWGIQSGEKWIADFLWLADIEQPVYFAALGVYVDNGSNVPDGFTDIANATYLNAYAPLSVKNLQTSFMRSTAF